jgi:hypothetical protein
VCVVRKSQRHSFEEPNVQEVKHGRHVEAREVALCLERRHLLGQQLDVRREVLELSVCGERIERCSIEEQGGQYWVLRYPNRSIGEADDGELVARVHLVLQVHEPERGRQVRPKCHDRAVVARGKWRTCILSMCLTRSSREKVFLRDLGRGHTVHDTKHR